tara:strand:- start:2239 stop:2481 length:243 start_codon:yes stop_codon:yes gene_type:complete
MMQTNSAFLVRTLGLLLLLLRRRRLFCARVSCVSEDVLCTKNLWRFNTNTEARDLWQKMTIVLFDEKKMTKFLLFTLLSF